MNPTEVITDFSSFCLPCSRIIPECPPAPVKRRPESTISLRSNLQVEPACVRSISLQDQSNPIGPVLGCPGAPTKKRSSRSVLRKSLLNNMVCVRSLRYHDHVLPFRPVTEALAPKKKPLKRTLSLRLNKGILPRPFQSRARRNIMRQLRTYRNMVRIMGVEDPAQNWINLDTIHSVPLNRAGNSAPPPTPRKSWNKMALNFQEIAYQMVPRKLDFEADSSDSEDDDNDNDKDHPGKDQILLLK